MKVKPKKHLGQHFLVDENISKKIADQFGAFNDCKTVLEIGPGTGAMTKYLLSNNEYDVHAMELDEESIAYLKIHYPALKDKIYFKDFLKADLKEIFDERNFAVVGNFPYNISSQILFKCIDYRNQIPEIMGMFQKEVAVRVAEKPGSKAYGILSVLLQAFYDIEYCFTVNENVFNPPPKVKSGVIRCTRNNRASLNCDEKLFIKVVKTAFNQRRKTLRNSLKPIADTSAIEHELMSLRPEKLSVEQFEELTNILFNKSV